MTPAQAAIDLIKQFEGCQLKAYPDPQSGAAPWTCGWGCTGPDVTAQTVWGQDEADHRLQQEILRAGRLVLLFVKAPLTQNQFDALTSMAYNLGTKFLRLSDGRPSTLLNKLNGLDYAGASMEILRWNSPGTAVQKGLDKRRHAEQALFLKA